MLAPGDELQGWVVERTLGEGGWGAVYLCHKALSARVKAAVKVLKARGEDRERERFIREAEALAALEHPSVVRVMDVGEDKVRGLVYLAMDFVEGQRLSERIAQGAMPEPEALAVLREAAAGLAHAHARGIFHRDIKLDNLILRPDGRVALVDFGIAVTDGRTRLTAADVIPGTLAYMPPETLQGEPPDLAQADVYALGQVMYELLTGEPAFRGDFRSVLSEKIRRSDLDPGARTGPDLRGLVRRMTSADRGQRPRSMAEILAALAAPPPAPARPAPGAAPRRASPWGKLAIFLAIAVLIAGLGVATLSLLGLGAAGLWWSASSSSLPQALAPDTAAPAASAALTPAVVDGALRGNPHFNQCFTWEYQTNGALPPALPVGFQVAGDGTVTAARVADPFLGTNLGYCVQDALLETRFPPFSGPPQALTYTFRMGQ